MSGGRCSSRGAATAAHPAAVAGAARSGSGWCGDGAVVAGKAAAAQLRQNYVKK